MNAKRRPASRLFGSPGCHTEARIDCTPLYDSVPVPELSRALGGSDLPGYLRLVGVAQQRGDLTAQESEALRDFATWLFQPVADAAAIVAGFRKGFGELAAATTPARADAVAPWSPFDPDALRRAACRGQGSSR